MENKDLESKKINNEQQAEAVSAGEAATDKPLLQTETETDQHGETRIVQRARTTDDGIVRNWNEDQSMNRSLDTEEMARTKVEHKDRNSDIAANRYPASHPDNHTNRGNIDLDE